jgi:hypothetical protein
MVPVVEGKDPLGLSGRVSNRLAGQLLHCITSITPRARYFSFLPWCVADYRQHQKGTRQDDGLDEAIRLRERALTLGCIAHHDGRPCVGGRLVGSEKGQAWYEKRGRSQPNLTKLFFAKNPALYAYYASLVNLGTFVEREGVELDEAGEVENTFSFDDLELTPLGQALAECYGNAVKNVACVRKIPTRPDDCSVNELAAWGARGGLCELTADGPDLEILRDLFFCRKGKSVAANGLRRDSLVLLLELVCQSAGDNSGLNTETFNDVVYFGETTSDYTGKDRVAVRIPHALQEIANRWRMFHFHYYLSVALETLFVFVVRQAREAGLRGVSHAELLAGLNSAATQKSLVQRLGSALPRRFLQMTPREIAGICGVSLAAADVAASETFDQNVRILHPLSESRLDYLIRAEAGFDTTFWNTPWNELGTFIVNRFVVRLHETLSFEKSSVQAKAFFQSDQHRLYWRNLHYDAIAVANSRLGSALQVLTDLGYIQRDPDARDLYRLSPGGKRCLELELRRMSGS